MKASFTSVAALALMIGAAQAQDLRYIESITLDADGHVLSTACIDSHGQPSGQCAKILPIVNSQSCFNSQGLKVQCEPEPQHMLATKIDIDALKADIDQLKGQIACLIAKISVQNMPAFGVACGSP